MSNIKIQDVDQRVQYTATSSQTVFAIPFPFLANSDIVAYQNSTKLDLGASPGEYGLSGAGNPGGGTLTLVTGATLNDIITIFGNQPIDRTSIYSATISNLTGSDLNNDFNREIIMLKQLWTTQNLLQLQYQPYAQVSQDEAVTIDRWIPKLAAAQGWRMNAAGTAIEAYDLPDGGVAPKDGPYLIQTADADIPSAQVMGALASGLVVNTTTTGVQLTRVLTGTANEIGVADGDGIAGAPTIGIVDNPVIPGNAGMGIPQGTTAQRPVSPSGIGFRYNTTLSAVEYYDGSTWIQLDDADLSQYLLLAGGTMTGALVLSGDATAALNPVTLQQMNAAIQNVHVACICATAGTDSLSTWTYDNGTAGVGSTLTAPSNGATTFDTSVVPVDGDSIFVIDQASNLPWQGAYTIVQGTGGTPTVLTRRADFDEASEMNPGDVFRVVQGDTYAGHVFQFTQTAAITVGTTDLTFNDITNSGLGTMANQDANAVAITGGTIDGVNAGGTTPLTFLGVDNVEINGSTINSTAGNDLNVNPANGQDLLIGLTGASTIIINGTTPFVGVIDDDTMATASNDTLATSESIKYYADHLTQILDSNGNEVVTFNEVASAVNYVELSNNSTGTPPRVAALGDDTDITLNLLPKGVGGLLFGATATSPSLTYYSEQTTNGANRVAVSAPASLASDLTVTWKSASSGYPALDTTDSDAWTAFTPGVTGFSSTALLTGYYKKIGKTCFCRIRISGTSNATSFTISGLPFANGLAAQNWQGFHFALNNSGNTIASVAIDSSATTAQVYNTTGSVSTGWTASNTKGLFCTLVYETT